MPAGDIDTTNIAYTELKDAYNEVSTPDPYVDPISMSKFRGVKYVTFSGTTIQEGQSIYTNTSTSANATFSWTCPSLVTSVSVVCCGGGGGGIYYNTSWTGSTYGMNGGGGGGLGWKNNITVVPGQSYTVQVGKRGINGAYSSGSSAGGDSYFISSTTVCGKGGERGRYGYSINGGGYVGDGGGNGGNAVRYSNSGYGPAGGGGGGGYNGNGGNGCMRGQTPSAGAGGGGGGAYQVVENRQSAGGGGVGPNGQGSNGAGGTYSMPATGTAGGRGGSGGANGYGIASNTEGGNYGGGGGGASGNSWGTAGKGGGGFVRIIWGANRSFPSTNTADSSADWEVGTYIPGTIPTGTSTISINNDFKGNRFVDMNPTMVITSSSVENGGKTDATSILFVLTSSEPIANFDVNDITVNNGTLSGFTQGGSNTVYNVTLTPVAVQDTVHTINIAAGAYTNADTTLNCKNLATQFTFTYSLGGILQDIMTLAGTLNNITGVVKSSSTKITSVCNAIHNAHDSFCVFAVVGYSDLAESLTGVSKNYTSSKPTISTSNFFYNSANNYLGAGGTIADMDGGSIENLSAIDGKKWMAMALYDGQTNGFKGILIWVFTDALVNSSGVVQSGSRSHNTVRSIFYPDPGSGYTYSQIYPVVIGNTGSITHSDVTGASGWEFSNNQMPSSAGCRYTNRFANDDGCWGFKLGDQVEGNHPGAYLANGTSSNPSFGLINPNSGDSQSKVYWNYSNVSYYSNTNHVGFVFSGDYS